MKVETFVKEFNLDFSQPFIPNGFAEAKIITTEDGYKYLNIRIGNRDVDFNLNTGKAEGSGTDILDGAMWTISRRK